LLQQTEGQTRSSNRAKADFSTGGNTMRHMRRVVALLISIMLIGAACQEVEDLPEAHPLLSEAADKIQTATSFKIEIDVSGYPVAIKTGDLGLSEEFPLVFEYANGTFAAPNQLEATVEVSLEQLRANIELVAIDQQQYMRSELITQNRWIAQEIIPGFTPASLLASNSGIPYALKTISDLEMVGLEDIDGVDVYHLKGEIEARNVYSLTFGLIGTQFGRLGIDVYILADEHTVEQIVLHEPLPNDAVEGQEPTTWTITVFDYNKTVEIGTPVMDDEGSSS